jgi:hypothetical protein
MQIVVVVVGEGGRDAGVDQWRRQGGSGLAISMRDVIELSHRSTSNWTKEGESAGIAARVRKLFVMIRMSVSLPIQLKSDNFKALNMLTLANYV